MQRIIIATLSIAGFVAGCNGPGLQPAENEVEFRALNSAENAGVNSIDFDQMIWSLKAEGILSSRLIVSTAEELTAALQRDYPQEFSLVSGLNPTAGDDGCEVVDVWRFTFGFCGGKLVHIRYCDGTEKSPGVANCTQTTL